MYYSKKLFIHLKKSFSLFLAFAIMISVCIVGGASLNASAATDSGNYYLITTANSDWQNKSVTYRLYDSSSNTVESGSVSASGAGDVYTIPSLSNGVKLEFSLAPFDLPVTAVKSGYNRIFLNSKSVVSEDGTYDYSNPYVHYYTGSTASQTGTKWPGVAMTKVSSQSDFYYADIPQGYKQLNFCDWDSTNNYALHQTSDQTIVYYGENAYFNGSRWENPRIRSVDIAAAASSQDCVYMDKDENLILSKFSFDGSSVERKPAYVYNENWKSQEKIYFTYSLVGEALSDSNKTYTVTTELEKETVNGYVMFKGYLPVDTKLCFHINQDNLKGCSNVTAYAEGLTGSFSSAFDDNTATYKIVSATENWMMRSQVNSINYDAVIGNSFGNNLNIVGVDATYFDYWSDNEQAYGYLNQQNYEDTKTGIENYWYQFDNYNAYISNIAKSNSSKWLFPLYFGNMFYDTEWKTVFENHSKSLTNINDYNDNYYYAVNNSNGMVRGGGKYTQSLQGLVYSKLDSNGDLQIANGIKAPYFDANALVSAKYNNNRVASVYKSYFPFRAETDESSKVTTYSFSSKNAKDNIYFSWDGTNPKQINYGAGEYYGVKDKLSNFGGDYDGYGIFPFNTNSNTKTTNEYSKTPSSTDGEFYIQTDSSKYYLWLFSGSSADKQIEITKTATVDGVNYLVVEESDYSGYAKCVMKPNKNDWNNKSGDLTISDLVSCGAVNTSGEKYSGKVISTYQRGGNDELDYGFGVRLDIDFRVPENGKLSNGDDVTFNFTGDDDIWVFIGEDSTGAGAELVLDLGGDHKETQGSINFATMKATANDVFADYSSVTSGIPEVGENQLCMQSDAAQIYAYIWSDGVTAKHLPMTQKVIDGKKFYYLDLDNYSSYTKVIFKSTAEGNWSNKTNDLNISDCKGKVLQWQNAAGYTPANYVSSTTHATNLGMVETIFNNGDKLDPNITYHMVVFYMERGESESNLSIDFTMTPANNDLTVNKSLDTADTVTEIANDLRVNETYDYTISDGNNAQGKAYKLNGAAAVLGSNGAFVLQDAGNAEFENTFDTGSEITVNESISSPLSYTTSWELVNKKNGLTIKSASGNMSEFILKDYDDESSSALLELDYLNKINTSSLLLSKSAVDEEGNSYETDQQFSFKLMLDLDGDNSRYSSKAYPVKYLIDGKSYSATQDGIITVGAGETVEIVGLPVGAAYTLYEQTASGFVPYLISDGTEEQSFNGTHSGFIKASDNQLSVTNKLNPVESGISVGKTLDTELYTGSKFSYTLNGLAQMTTSHRNDDGTLVDTLDTTNTNITVFEVHNGSVTFNNITFDKVGYYRYYITEGYTSSVTDEEKAVYNLDNRIFLVEVSVTADGSELVVNEPSYSVITADKAQEFLNADINAKNEYFTNDASYPTFENTTSKAGITVNKSGQADEQIAGTTFALIKVSAENVFESSDLSSVISDISSNPARAATGVTDSSGNIAFTDLLVYQDGSGYYTKENNSVVWKDSTDNDYVSGNQVKQVYCLFEYSPSAGYNPNGVINYYTFPIYNEETNEYQFDVTASYVDGVIVMPDASGTGMNVFFVIGFVILGLGATLVLSYLAYDKAQRKKRKQRYNSGRK